MTSHPRYVSPPLLLPAPAQKTSVRRMAEGDSGEMSAFLNKHRALGERGDKHNMMPITIICVSQISHRER